MSADNKNNDDKIPKLLKKLSSVKASDDFEMRLRHRILKRQTEGNTKSEFKLSEIFFAYPLPAYSLSFLTIIAVGALSYYTFIRTGITPTQTIRTLQGVAKVEPESSTDLPSEKIEALEKNVIVQDQQIKRTEKVSSNKKQAFRAAPSDLGNKESQQTQLPTAAENVTTNESTANRTEMEKADQVGASAAHQIERKKSEVKQLSVPLSKQRGALLQAQSEKAELTFIDSTSRVDTSNRDSLKKRKP
jgi:hypothetical protein